MIAAELTNLAWRKSSRSGSNSNCVEFARVPDGGGGAVRDSKAPDGSVLWFTEPAWASFVSALRSRALGGPEGA